MQGKISFRSVIYIGKRRGCFANQSDMLDKTEICGSLTETNDATMLFQSLLKKPTQNRSRGVVDYHAGVY
jgi:hypothetical protein